MVNLARHVHRILEATHGGNGEPAFPGYVRFDGEARPRWWSTQAIECDDWGHIFGAYENTPASCERAVIIAENGLAILSAESGAVWIPYTAIDRWERLSKEPLATALVVWTASGELVSIPFERGGAFAFVQFLMGAIREHSRSSDQRPR